MLLSPALHQQALCILLVHLNGLHAFLTDRGESVRVCVCVFQHVYDLFKYFEYQQKIYDKDLASIVYFNVQFHKFIFFIRLHHNSLIGHSLFFFFFTEKQLLLVVFSCHAAPFELFAVYEI